MAQVASRPEPKPPRAGAFSSANGIAATATGVQSNANGVEATATGNNSNAIGVSTATATGRSSNAQRCQRYRRRPRQCRNWLDRERLWPGQQRARRWHHRAIGQVSLASATNATAIGQASTASAIGATAVGQGQHRGGGINATAIGTGATAAFANSAAFGAGATAQPAPNQIAVGTASNTRITKMPGITSAASLAAQSGPTQVVNDRCRRSPRWRRVLPGRTFPRWRSPMSAPCRRRCGRRSKALAMAIALGGGALPADKKFAISTNWGTFRGENAMGLSAQMRLNDYVVMNGGVAARFCGTRRRQMLGRFHRRRGEWKALRSALFRWPRRPCCLRCASHAQARVRRRRNPRRSIATAW